MTRRELARYLLLLLCMVLVSVLLLFGLSVFTYVFKWQSPEALAGIIVIYIVTGLSGGLMHRRLFREQEARKRLWSGFLLGSAYMLLLVAGAVALVGVEQMDLAQMTVIWILIASATGLGAFLKFREK